MQNDVIKATEILTRLLVGAGLKKDAQLAALLNVSPQAVSQARRKGKIPEKWLGIVADKCGVSLDWLHWGTAPQPGAQTPGTGIASRAVLPKAEGKKSGVPSAPSSLLLPTRREFPDIELLSVPLVSATLSAGVGSLATDDEILDFFAFRSDWLCKKGDPDQMVLMKVYGDSMEPEIRNGDMVLIDQSKKNIYPHTIYAVGVNEEIYIKQVVTLPGHRLILRSLNERYSPIEIDLRGDMAEWVRIIGKVIWWCREA